MTMKKNFVLGGLLAGLLVVAASPQTQAGVNPYGNWTLTDGRVTVKVVACNGNQVCANVIRLDKPNNADGTPKLDLKNKNTTLRSRRLIGMPVIEGMVPVSGNVWKGQIYSSDDGSNYRATAVVNGDHLDVKGCWIVFCRDLNFVRSK
jgi:uncharacterized protein (DUF2147 family)